jgi:hypothetical protein
MAGEGALLTAIRSMWWACGEAQASASAAWSALVALVERCLPRPLFLALQTLFVVATTVVLFALAVGVAWALLWKLVLSKIRFVVALKNELLLGQPTRPAPGRSAARQRPARSRPST